jgi:hypothetical protein
MKGVPKMASNSESTNSTREFQCGKRCFIGSSGMVRYHVERSGATIGTWRAMMPTIFTSLSIFQVDALPCKITHYRFRVDKILSASGWS